MERFSFVEGSPGLCLNAAACSDGGGGGHRRECVVKEFKGGATGSELFAAEALAAFNALGLPPEVWRSSDGP